MYHFFVEPEQIEENHITVLGSDVNHIVNVLRQEVDDEIIIGDGLGKEYNCCIESLTKDSIRCKIQSVKESEKELPVNISLFQGAPKQDKMDLVTQKCVELGVHDINVVYTLRSIVKYDQKKTQKKLARWRSISESAAKQSKRGIIPEVEGVLSWKDMLVKLADYDVIIVPYENSRGMRGTREILRSLKKGQTVAYIIGPEGGFDNREIQELMEIGGHIISLGSRVLRTETAGMVFLSMVSYELEEV